MIEYLFPLLLGIIAGCITGIAPGIHINLVGSSLLAISFASSPSNAMPLAIFIVSMSITHTFLDFVPSIFLGSPDDEMGLSVLPGHKMLLQGRGIEAVGSTILGGLIALGWIIIFAPLFILFLPGIYPIVQNIMFPILAITSASLIMVQDNKFLAMVVFLFSGLLGLFVFNLELKEPLLPLLSGLFGGSSIFMSIFNKPKLPRQKKCTFKKVLQKESILKSAGVIAISSPLVSFLPGLGSSQAAIIGSNFVSENNPKKFLTMLGGINTLVMGLSFVTLYSIGKSRSGSAAFIGVLLGDMGLPELTILIIAAMISGIIAAFISFRISQYSSSFIGRINYSRLSFFVLLFLLIITFIFSGFIGLLIFFTGTFIGIFAALSNIRKTNLMGCIMLQTLLIYAPF